MEKSSMSVEKTMTISKLLRTRPWRALLIGASFLVCGSAHADGWRGLTKVHDWFSTGNELPLTGDFNGDGLDDLVTLLRETQGEPGAGDVYVSLSNGDSPTPTFTTSLLWSSSFCRGSEYCLTGDVDGDGDDDLIAFVRSSRTGSDEGDVLVALSNGSTGFGAPQKWNDYFGIGNEFPAVADVDGDGDADIVTFIRNTKSGTGAGDVVVARSNGSAFVSPTLWHGSFASSGEWVAMGDFNGDARADMVRFVRSTLSGASEGDVWVSLSSGSSFGTETKWNDWFSVNGETPMVGDFNGDTYADVATFVKSSVVTDGKGDAYVAYSNGSTAFAVQPMWHHDLATQGQVVAIGKVNRDTRSDVVIFNRSAIAGAAIGDVYVGISSGPSLPTTHATLADFGYDTYRNSAGAAAVGTRPVLTILMRAGGVPHAHTALEYQNRMFGGSVTGMPDLPQWFQESSAGVFNVTNAGIVGPYDFTDTSTAATKYADAIQAAAAAHNFAIDDVNHDGIVDANELIVVVIDTLSGAGGQGLYPPNYFSSTVTSQGVTVRSAIAFAGHQAPLALVIHEVCHSLGVGDNYGGLYYADKITPMAQTDSGGYDFGVMHLDPWNKMRLGWIQPRIYSMREPGNASMLSAAGLGTPYATNPPIILYNPSVGVHSFFMLEWRSKIGSDVGAGGLSSGAGLVPWYVETDVSNNLVVPPPYPASGSAEAVLWPMMRDSTTPNKLIYSADNANWWIRSDSGDLELPYRNGYDVGAGTGVRVRVGQQSVDDTAAVVEWGFQSFVPPTFFSAPGSPLSRATPLTLSGYFGTIPAGRPIALQNGPIDYDLSITNWTQGSLTFSIPGTVPPGSYYLLGYTDSSRTSSGPGIFVNVN